MAHLCAQYFRMHVSSLTTVSGHAVTQLVNKELQLECIGAISSKNYASTSMDASLQITAAINATSCTCMHYL